MEKSDKGLLAGGIDVDSRSRGIQLRVVTVNSQATFLYIHFEN